MPPFDPPLQFWPPQAQISTPCTLDGMAPVVTKPALVMPPSPVSLKVTLVALGSMPKAKAVSRSPPTPVLGEVLLRVISMLSELVPNPVTVMEPFPVRS
jgi:hypothetical protein